MDFRRRHERSPSSGDGRVRSHFDRSHFQQLSMLNSTNNNNSNNSNNNKQVLEASGFLRNHTFLMVILLVMVAVALVLVHSSRIQTLQQQKYSHHQRRLPLVCSHQILNPPLFGLDKSQPTTEDYLAPDGSLDAMTALWHKGGVHCFDVDVVTLSDGTLLASHPRRLKAAIYDREPQTENMALEEYTIESLSRILGLSRNSNDDTSSIRGRSVIDGSSPFPIFDKEILPHFAKLVQNIPGAFSEETVFPSPTPWSLKGPLLNIDLKEGPYLTKEKVLELAHQIHALRLEDYVAICVTSDEGPSTKQPSLLQIIHEHNLESVNQRRKIPLTLVLRDLVPQDANVDRIRNLVEHMYPESIRALVPSFKFPISWYEQIRYPPPKTKGGGHDRTSNELWRLPMTVWTIDSKEDYEFVASVVATTTIEQNGNDWNGLPMASAVVANRPMEILLLSSSSSS